MEEHEYSSLGQMWGSMSQKNVLDPTAFERANYMKVLSSYALRAHRTAVARFSKFQEEEVATGDCNELGATSEISKPAAFIGCCELGNVTIIA